MAERIVIKRTAHPDPELRKLARRWFTYRGRDFGVSDGGPGNGWEVFDLAECATVGDDYGSLRQLRDQAPGDIELWADDNGIPLDPQMWVTR